MHILLHFDTHMPIVKPLEHVTYC